MSQADIDFNDTYDVVMDELEKRYGDEFDQAEYQLQLGARKRNMTDDDIFFPGQAQRSIGIAFELIEDGRQILMERGVETTKRNHEIEQYIEAGKQDRRLEAEDLMKSEAYQNGDPRAHREVREIFEGLYPEPPEDDSDNFQSDSSGSSRTALKPGLLSRSNTRLLQV